MQPHSWSRRRSARLIAFLSIGALVAGFSAPAAFASSVKKKHLSLSSITASGASSSAAELQATVMQGFFRAQGLNNVTVEAISSAAQQVTLLLTGSVNFGLTGVSTVAAAVAQGAPLRATEMQTEGSQQELVITQAAATQFGVPSTGNGKAGATAQLRALKGSHLAVGVSTVTSNSAIALVAAAKSLGLTYGVSCSTCDISLVTVGSATLQTAAIMAGKVPAIIGTPPNTVIASPATITIEVGNIPPVTAFATNYLTTTISMIQQHPDVVQAVTTAMVQISQWLPHHPGQAEKDLAVSYASQGITSPEEQEYLYAGVEPSFTHPVPTKASYAAEINATNLLTNPPVTVAYSKIVVPRFIAVSLKALHLKL